MSAPVGVVGGGLGGLAAACVLAARGHRVILWEKNASFGGTATTLAQDGFRFDLGPTALTLPRVLHRIFAEAGRATADLLDLRRLDPQCRCVFADGSTLDLTEDSAAMAASLAAFAPGSGQGYAAFMALSARQHEAAAAQFFWRPLDGPASALAHARPFGRAALHQALALRIGATAAQQIQAHTQDARVAQALQLFMFHTGNSPFASPAALCGLAHMQMQDGLWYPIGGVAAVARALGTLARTLGVELRAGATVRRIAAQDGQVAAVQTADGDTTQVAAAISNVDAVRTYRDLIGGPAERAFSARRQREPSCSTVVLHLGLSRAYPQLAHHTFLLSRDAEEECDAIYDRGRPPPDPTCHVTAPARTDPSVCPPGGEALHVLAHVPYLRVGHDWGEMLPAFRRRMLDKLKRAGMPDIEDRIVTEHALTPQDLRDRFGALHGAAYGLASHGRFAGAFKPGNRSRHVRGLYLAGGAAHPGAGVAFALMGGWIAADAWDADAGKKDVLF